MNVSDRLASAQGRRDEQPNIDLAHKIVKERNLTALKDLVDLLEAGKKSQQNDAIKVLYEIGALEPELIAPYAETFLSLLRDKNNRLQWGAMTALATISERRPEFMFRFLPLIIEATKTGSVITRDQTVNILISLVKMGDDRSIAFGYLLELLETAPVMQLPMYAEKTIEIVSEENRSDLLIVLDSRREDIVKESSRKRIEKVIRKINRK